MALVGCTGSEPRDARVIIIGIDGCRPDTLAVANTPNLDALIRDGSFSDQAQNDEIPVSGPCWSAALCGVWSEKHGVRSVTSFDGNRYDQYPYFFQRVKQARPNALTATILQKLQRQRMCGFLRQRTAGNASRQPPEHLKVVIPMISLFIVCRLRMVI